MTSAVHTFNCRVYYEDTDLAGLVYHANYLKFIERGRSEWVRALGIDQRALRAEGRVFAVRRIEAEYLRPAHYDDELAVETRAEEVGGARIVLRQRVLRDATPLFCARLTLAMCDLNGRATRLPAGLRRDLA